MKEQLQQFTIRYVLLSEFAFLPPGAQCFPLPLFRMALFMMFCNRPSQQLGHLYLNNVLTRRWIGRAPE